jgi:glycyl-tRNA synthetase beta chain
MTDLLLELRTEEVPARMQRRACADLERLVGEKLKEAELATTLVKAHATPRRLALRIEGLPAAQGDRKVEHRGPRTDAPAKAIDGFLKARGIAREACEERDTDKGRFLFFVEEKKGRATADVLGEILPKALGELPWPKSMRWGAGATRWVRPIHALLATLDGKALALEFAGLKASDQTVGHRFLSTRAFPARRFRDYAANLRANHVLLDLDDRKTVIAEDVRVSAEKEGLAFEPEDELLEEVAGLVEWPVVLIGGIDAPYMELPPEVLTAVMRKHQKYFALKTKDGKLASRFALVANIHARDGGKAVVAGNERVLRARFADAKFFWDLDRKTPLVDLVPKLAEVTFHAKLGSIADKVARLKRLARAIAEAGWIANCDPAAAERAAELCKADLVSGMVGEFAELQGIMGRYYARLAGESEAVAEAIREHYAPQGPKDTCPTAPVSAVVALADKLDTLVGFFSIDEKPTGSKDPFALRRAALGILRFVLENKLRLPLAQALKFATDIGGHSKDGVIDELLAFFADRLKVHMREQGLRHDIVDSVIALGGEDDFVRLIARAEAVRDFLGSDDGKNLLAAQRRASNILKIEEKKDAKSYDGEPKGTLFKQGEETDLYNLIAEIVKLVDKALATEKYGPAMQALATLRKPVDAFFDKVRVNAEEPEVRANRLFLLSRIRGALGRVADFSRIEG